VSKLKLIVGLGNPGQQYAQTRHNAGFWFVERISETFNITMTLDKKISWYGWARLSVWHGYTLIVTAYFYE